MEKENIFDANLGVVDQIKIEKMVQDTEKAHQAALTPKKTLSDMMK